MKFCAACGYDQLSFCVPPGDVLARWVCLQCREIYYQNPKIVVGLIPYWHDKILLCKRAIEPRSGFWTFPAGFLENGETVQAGAIRETQEEAQAEVQKVAFFNMISLPHLNQVHLIFVGQLAQLHYAPTLESSEVVLFDEGSIPWADLAFRTVDCALQHYRGDRKTGVFSVYTDEIFA